MTKVAEEKKSNKKLSRIIMIAILVIGSVIGFIKYRESQHYEKTDDAQLETDISPVSARVSGYIAKVFFTDNQQVKKGDTLLVLDDRDMRLKVEQSEAALQNAIASLDVARANTFSVKEGSGTSIYKIDELKIRMANSQKEYDRYKKMLEENSATQQQFEKVQTEKEALEKQLNIAKQQQKESNSKTTVASEQIKVAESIVKQRQSDLDYAKLQLSYSVIIAPFSGVVSKKNAVTGQLIQTGQPFCSIVANKKIWVIANFKETQITRMKVGMKVEINVDAYSEKEIVGKVSSFSSATGSKFSLIPPDNASGNFVKVVQRVPVKIELDSTNNVLQDLKPGMSVDVKVILN
jgi:membrane fusion protein (multidrug efflux system)